MITDFIEDLKEDIERATTVEYLGKVDRVVGMSIEAIGPMVNVGEMCKIYSADESEWVFAEVVGFKEEKVLLMPLGNMEGIGAGNKVVAAGVGFGVPVGMDLKGRILNALGEPIDNKGKVHPETFYELDRDPPNPLKRERIHEILPIGVKVIDGLLTMGKGQRMGIFAGSGVGKSTLMGMIARGSDADINVIVLCGERGREVLDFVEKSLKADGLARSVVVVATSDQPAMLRIKSCMTGTAIAEYFRDQGYNVMLMMDSLTRFAMAQREVGMAVGEPPVARGYTPSVYSKLPRLLERSGTSDKGSITAIYTVLVDGDDMNEPISDTVRGILDGHIVLSRKLAHSNHYPAIDALASISRLMADIASPEHKADAGQVKNWMSTYNEAQDLINIGAYKKGTNPEIDMAIKKQDAIKNFLLQDVDDAFTFEETVDMLDEIANG
ncbi:MAG: flagellar protein export ATPase FliI [Clostridia bacterium]|nr:flagellar protein export ATPase FliI [Clostridia bacterium]